MKSAKRIANTSDLGNYIRLRRKEYGFTQSDLADLSGSSLMFISNLENGKETAQVGKVLNILNVLSLDTMLQPRENR